MTLRLEVQLDDGYGSSLAATTNDLWVSATTGQANLWRGDRLTHSVRVPGFQAGRPSITSDGSTAVVGTWKIDVDSGEVTDGQPAPSWLVDAIDDGSVTPADFSMPLVMHVPGSSRAVVHTRFLEPRGIDATSGYSGPTSQLLLVDLDAGQLTALLMADAGSYRVLADASAGLLATASDQQISTWSTLGEPRGTWECNAIVDAVAVSSTSDVVAVLDRAGMISLCDADGDVRRRWQAHTGAGGALAWHGSGSWLASGGRDGDVAVWDVTTHEPSSIGECSMESAEGLVFLGHDRLVVATDRVDQTMSIFAVET